MKITEGIIGPGSGKIGPVVACRMKNGVCYVRMRPQVYRDANTLEQQKNRFKMRMCMEFMTIAKPFVNNNLGRYVVGEKMSAVNLAVHWNYRRMTTVSEDASSCVVNYDKILLSDGPVAVIYGQVAMVVDEKIVLAWDDNCMGICASTEDQLQVMVYNERLGEAKMFYDAARRVDLHCSLSIDRSWMHDRLHIYLVFRNWQGERSLSGYCCFNGQLCGESTRKNDENEIDNLMINGSSENFNFRGEGKFTLELQQSADKEVMMLAADDGFLGYDLDKTRGILRVKKGLKPPE